MRSSIIFMLFTTLVHNSFSQTIDFEAYNRITNSNLELYVNLFEKRSLPLSSKDFFVSDIVNNASPKLTDNLETEFLKRNGEYLIDPVFIDEYESGEQQERYGYFVPLFKLPTNGDYVLLVVWQQSYESDFTRTAWVFKYDLNGEFIGFVSPGWFINDGAPYIDCRLNEDLTFDYSYIYPELVGDYEDCDPCTSDYKEITYQLNSDGTQMEMSFTGGRADFEYSAEGRFVKTN